MAVQRIKCRSEIVGVVVYARGSVIRRSVTLPMSLEQGEYDLVIGPLSPLTDPASIRLHLDSGLQAGSHAARLLVPDDAPQENKATRVLGLERELALLEMRHQQLEEQGELLTEIDPDFGPQKRIRVESANRFADGLGVVELVARLSAEIDAALADVEAEIEDKSMELCTARLEAAQASSSETELPHPIRELVVRASLAVERPSRFEISYALEAARWWPAYTIRLEPGSHVAELTVEAFVAQASFEDWRECSLALSTADLEREIGLPELASWRLGRQQQEKKRGYRKPPMDLNGLYLGYDRAMKGLVEPERKPAKPLASRAPEPAPVAEFELDDMVFQGAMPEEACAAPVMDIPPPMPQRRESAKRKKKAAKGMGLRSSLVNSAKVAAPGGGGGGEPPAPPDWESVDQWLDFQQLRLAEERHPMRGQLVPRAEPSDSSLERARRAIAQLSPPLESSDPKDARGAFDHIYRAQGKVDVPSNALAHRLSLQSASSTYRARYRIVASESNDAFQEILVTNPLEAPLLAGPMDVFVGGAMVTTTRLEAADIGAEMSFGQGVEERVKFARNIRVSESTSGLFGGTSVVEHRVSLEVSSSLPHPATIELVDRLPWSTDNEVEVELVSSSPNAREYEQAERGSPIRGGLVWTLTLDPGARKTVNYVYTIALPSKNELIGGNRRD